MTRAAPIAQKRVTGSIGTPLAWLRAGRSGCVVINPEIAAHILGGLPVGAEDERHAHALNALRVPAPRARVHAEWELVS